MLTYSVTERRNRFKCILILGYNLLLIFVSSNLYNIYCFISFICSKLISKAIFFYFLNFVLVILILTLKDEAASSVSQTCDKSQQ